MNAMPAPGNRQSRELLSLGRKPAARKPRGPVEVLQPAPAPISLVPSAPALIPLGQLRRATENVRHTRVDEDCDALADDIEAHGLLQSLIGFEDGAHVEVVGGGRRLKALRIVRDRGRIDDAFLVPVLIRGADEAVELSLAENLQQRTMSPVDEFFAFQKLMEGGATSPADLAKRFGWTERLVRQRLRLAALAKPVLDALAAREITLDAAMAYASSQDIALQEQVFSVQKKRGHKAHAAGDVRHFLRMKGIGTADQLYKFVGAEKYEREGGTYEDDLFAEPGKERVLAQPFLLETIANTMADFQAARLIEERLKHDDAWAPTIAGFVKIPDLRAHRWGTGNPGAMRAPAGFVLVERADGAPLWRTIRNNGFNVHVVVGVDDDGELVAVPRYAFVPVAQKTAVEKPALADLYASRLTPEQEQKAARERGIIRWSRRLAVGPFAGTPLEGRAFWQRPGRDFQDAETIDGVAGFMVCVGVFVTEAEVAAHRKDAEKAYDDDLAAIAAADADRQAREEAADRRHAELLALDPPAIVVVDGLAWERRDDASYAPLDDAEDGFLQSWHALLANFDVDDVNATYADRGDFDAAMSAASAGADA